ncbi:hypothetical protein GCM10011391_23310 [Pullulanibacillus camelliae]|uniref:Uncharacterized protein n=1 Tax=Pullulanibacillus camelliae TaxID=1707096 RepID=A0A8J2YHT2_9BACL|nr:hypothetical protein GCM10011391_23310 [Pullulanibacillus camelliae]
MAEAYLNATNRVFYTQSIQDLKEEKACLMHVNHDERRGH